MEEVGKYIWLEEEEEHGWVPVKITEITADTYKVIATINDEVLEYELDKNDFKIMEVHPSCIEGVDDLLMMGDFNEPTLLQNTRARYYKDLIYSFIGTPILIAVNPYKKLYSNDAAMISKFKQYFKTAKLQGADNIEKPSPHLYYIAEASYQDMIVDKKNQSIIISGESGSGKTESTKIILKYLATVSSELEKSQQTQTESVEKQVLDSNPLLEAFGNAKTVKNNNSSRFGKFIQVSFTEFGKIISAKIFNYLLEKSRIVKIQSEERNYHIFYQFLYGSSEEEKAKFSLKEPEYYKYLNGGCMSVDDTDDVANFIETKDCMSKLKFNPSEIDLMFSVLSGILHLGNVEFDEQGNTIIIQEETYDDFITASEMIGVSQDSLLKILTKKKYTDPLSKKVIEKSVSIIDANNNRDAISKVLYARMFDWIVKKINSAISNSEKEKGNKDKERLKIGILDIFGFEIFENNSFEQLCINYANERLQQFFNNSVFKLEQEEYIREKIDWSKVQFEDNKEIIDLIDNTSKSIFSLLDSEAMLKNTDDKKFRDNVYNHLSGNKHLKSVKQSYGDTILIQHYAGVVEYLVYEFIEKNNDQLNNDISEAFEDSKNKLIKHLFKKEEKVQKKGAIGAKDGPNKIQTDSLSKQFKKQLDELLKMLSQSNPRYVKCIKPNNSKRPRIFESLDVNRQLLSAGVLEAIKIRKQGYSVRRSKEEFVKRYSILTPSINTKSDNSPQKWDKLSLEMFQIFKSHPEFKEIFLSKMKVIQIGLSKIFMKDDVKNFLEMKLSEAMMKYIITIQAFSRMILGRKKWRNKKRFSLRIQKKLRGFFMRKKWVVLKHAYKFQHFFRDFSKKFFCYVLKEQGNVYHHIKLEEKRKKAELELKNLEENERRRNEERQKTVSEQKFSFDGPSSIANYNNKKDIDSYGEISNTEIQLLKDLQGVKQKEKKAKKGNLLGNLLSGNNNNPGLEDMLKKEIENLQIQLENMKEEKDKVTSELDHAKESIIKKDKEIEFLKQKADNTVKNENDDLNHEFTFEVSKKQLNERTEEDIEQLKYLENEVKRVKKENNEKDSTIDILNLKISELTKNNKSLNELSENLKDQINKGKERLNNEVKSHYDQIQELERQKCEFEKKIRDLELASISNTQQIKPVRNPSTDRRVPKDGDSSVLQDLKKENKNIMKKTEEIKTRYEKDIATLKTTLSVKEARIKELEVRQKTLEDDVKIKTEATETLRLENDTNKEKIQELLIKLESYNNNSNKFRDYEKEVIKMKSELENINRKKENEIRELKDSIDKQIQMNERLKKIEQVLKEELNNKDEELTKRQINIKDCQDENDKLTDTVMKLKKENLAYKGKLEILEVDYKNKIEVEMKNKTKDIEILKDKLKQYEKVYNTVKETLKKKQRVIEFKKDINLLLVELLKIKRSEVQYLEAHKYTNSSNLKENIEKLRLTEQDLLNKMNEMTSNPDYTDSEDEDDEEEENENENSFEEDSGEFQG